MVELAVFKAKRLTLYVDHITHRHIKKVSADRDIPMREWVLEAIADKIKKDFELGFIEDKK